MVPKPKDDRGWVGRPRFDKLGGLDDKRSVEGTVQSTSVEPKTKYGAVSQGSVMTEGTSYGSVQGPESCHCECDRGDE